MTKRQESRDKEEEVSDSTQSQEGGKIIEDDERSAA